MNKKRKNPTGTCALCGKVGVVLEESHIIPKFVFREQKRDSVSKGLRNPFEPNRPLQDGYKEYLLCKACEEKFSKYENKFAQKIFIPFVEDTLDVMKYEEWLADFIISISWRILHIEIKKICTKNFLQHNNLKMLKQVEEELRQYLLRSENQHCECKFENHIFFFTDITSLKRINGIFPNIFFRGTTIEHLAQTEEGYYVVCNLLGILLVTIIKKETQDSWEGTRVFNKGCIKIHERQIIDSKLLMNLVELLREANKSLEKMSDEQRKKITEKMKKDPEKLKNSRVFKDALKDNELYTK